MFSSRAIQLCQRAKLTARVLLLLCHNPSIFRFTFSGSDSKSQEDSYTLFSLSSSVGGYSLGSPALLKVRHSERIFVGGESFSRFLSPGTFLHQQRGP